MLRPNRCLEEIIKNFQAVKIYVLKTSINNNETNLVGGHQDKRYFTECGSKDAEQLSHPSDASREKTSDEAIPGRCSENYAKLKQQNPVHPRSPTPGQSSTYQQQKRTPSVSQLHVQESLSQPSPVRFQQQTQRPSSSKTIKEVPCPVCSTVMRESLINVHLDFCLNKNKPPKRKPLPKMCYNIMKDQELRKRLRELGLSAVGDKNTLINRHKKYTILYNSECDAVEPRSIEDLRIQFEQEEAESRRLLLESRYAAAKVKSVDINTIEKENVLYIQKHKDSFDRLINDIKQRQPVKTENKPKDEVNELKPKEDEKKESTEENKDSDDEVTVLEVPPKVFETISLSDSNDSDSDGSSTEGLSVSSGSTSMSDAQDVESVTDSSSFSIPDPMEPTESIQSKGISLSSIEGQSISLSTTELNTRNASQNSSLEEVLSHETLLLEPSSSRATSLEKQVKPKPTNKRSKSPTEESFVRKMSLRRRV